MKKFAGDGFIYCFQEGNDLGERMQNAFETLFLKDFKKIIIVGSDLLDLDTTIIETAFDKRIPLEIEPGAFQTPYYYIQGGCGKMVSAFHDFIVDF